MLFVCHPKILHEHCPQFLLGVKMAPRETENNAYAKFWADKQRTFWCVKLLSVVVNYWTRLSYDLSLMKVKRKNRQECVTHLLQQLTKWYLVKKYQKYVKLFFFFFLNKRFGFMTLLQFEKKPLYITSNTINITSLAAKDWNSLGPVKQATCTYFVETSTTTLHILQTFFATCKTDCTLQTRFELS